MCNMRCNEVGELSIIISNCWQFIYGCYDSHVKLYPICCNKHISCNSATNASSDKMILCTQCHSNKNKPPNAPHVVYNSPTSMRSIMVTNLLHVQLLIFLEIGVHIQSKDSGFSIGEIVGTSLMNNPLLACYVRYNSLQIHWKFNIVSKSTIATWIRHEPILSNL